MAEITLATPQSRAHARPRRISRITVNVVLDLALTIVFIVAMEEHFTGLALHELLGLFFGGLFLIHILLHWDWVVSITRTFFRKLLHESRLNYVLNALLLLAALTVSVTGILISRTLGLSLDWVGTASETLEQLHMISAELILLVVALHVALHWKWILTNGVRLFAWLPRRQSHTSR